MKNFRTLDLAVEFYNLAAALSLPGHLKEQLLRASSSIALNLGEGAARPTKNDQRRFYNYAMGSLRECQTIFKLARTEEPPVMETADKLGAALFCLIRSAG